MSKDTITVLDATFKSEVLDSQTPVLVDFWAAWCAPCRAIAPALEELATQYKGQLKIAKVDIDENPAISRKYGIKNVPTVLVFRKGEKDGEVVGAARREKLVAALGLEPS